MRVGVTGKLVVKMNIPVASRNAITVLKKPSANPVTPAMAHGSKDAEGRLLGPSAATQRGYLQDRAPGAFRTDRPPVRSPMRRPATAPLVHTAHEMRGVHKRVCIW